MAPKRRGSVLGAPVTTGKRTARRPVREPSPSDSSSTNSDNPGLPSSQVDTLAGRMITMGRKVDFEFFESEGFNIGHNLKELGWDKLCSLDVPTYPALVKEFYVNLSRGDGGIISSVRGKRIHLTFQILGRLLSIPITGLVADIHSDRSSALSRMLGREVTEFEEIRANQLPLELRLLHNICSRILFPKTGRFEYVSERDIVIMDCVLTGQAINLAAMMIHYMAEAGGKRRSSLPYGMVLTMVFRSQGITILDNEPSKNLRHTDYYSLATLHRMGFVKVKGQWERKGSLDERATEVRTSVPSEAGPSVRIPSPQPSCPVPTPVPEPPSSSTSVSVGFSDIQLGQLKGLLDAQKEDLKIEFDNNFMNLRETLYSLDDRISKIESTLGSSTESLKDDLKNIFEELKDIGGDSETYSKCNAELQDKIMTACAFVDRRLKEFVRTQSEGMGRIIEDLQRLIKRNT